MSNVSNPLSCRYHFVLCPFRQKREVLSEKKRFCAAQYGFTADCVASGGAFQVSTVIFSCLERLDCSSRIFGSRETHSCPFLWAWIFLSVLFSGTKCFSLSCFGNLYLWFVRSIGYNTEIGQKLYGKSTE